MENLNNFEKYNEGLRSLKHTLKRRFTGKSAGEEIETLSDKQIEKLTDLYNQNPDNPIEAARYLRSIIIKEKNSQFGIGLALTVAGAAMIYKAYLDSGGDDDTDIEDDDVVIEDDYEEIRAKSGDSMWSYAEKYLPKDIPPGEKGKATIKYTLELCQGNGKEYFYSGSGGSPGLKADTWYSVKDAFAGKYTEIPKSMIGPNDGLKVGELVKIIPYKK